MFKIIILGCGSIGKCCLYYLKDFFNIDYKNVYVIDKYISTSKFPSVQEAIKDGAHFIKFKITSKNIENLLTKIIKCNKNDLVIDLTTRTPTYKIFVTCRELNLHYINTTVETESNEIKSCIEGSHWQKHMNLIDLASKTKDCKTTSIIEFGMNPGLISIMTKQGILDIAKYVLKNSKRKDAAELKTALGKKDYNILGALLKIRVIHCSEYDSQVPNKKNNKKITCTWSCMGLVDEAFEDAEIAIGTHEETVPFDEKRISNLTPQVISICIPSIDIKAISCVPESIDQKGNVKFINIEGSCIHHGENQSCNRFLGTLEWSPTMHYVYKLNPETERIFNKYNSKTLLSFMEKPNNWKVLNVYDDDLVGYDNVGATFILEEDPLGKTSGPWSFWTGSILHTDYTKNVLKDPYFGPTPLQVMCGILSACQWMLKHPNKGMVFSENIDEGFILNKCKKYLGTFYSAPIPKDQCNITGCDLNSLIVSSNGKHNKHYTVQQY